MMMKRKRKNKIKRMGNNREKWKMTEKNKKMNKIQCHKVIKWKKKKIKKYKNDKYKLQYKLIKKKALKNSQKRYFHLK
jgi:hypothetical protein